jgi:hypothetical protein
MQNYFFIGVFILNQLNIVKSPAQKNIAIIGGGPAGLMAAEVIASAGHAVSVYDAMPSVGRKFLLAGVGGMNITHAEPEQKFLGRYVAHPQFLETIQGFNANALREWIHGLGIETFVGSSGRVFPREMKAAPLLRVWLHRLRGLGVNFFPRHRWVGWNNGKLHFHARDQTASSEKMIEADAVILALGGASWQRLGSDGAWVDWLAKQSVRVNTLQPSNCGFEVYWSEGFREQYAGAQLHGVGLSVDGKDFIRSEAIISAYGIEGTGVYALSGKLRRELNRSPATQLVIDLLPDFSLEKIQQRLTNSRGKNSLSNFLRKQLNLPPVKIALLRERTDKSISDNPAKLAAALKGVAVPIIAMRPIDEAISTAGVRAA